MTYLLDRKRGRLCLMIYLQLVALQALGDNQAASLSAVMSRPQFPI